MTRSGTSQPPLLPAHQTLPRLCLFGDGKMSRAVRAAAEAWDVAITNVFTGDDLRNGWPRRKGDLKGAEVGVDFSGPEAVLPNVRRAVDLELPLVVGTTGWQDAMPDVEAAVLNGDGALLHAPNFSYAMNVLLYLLKRAALLFEGMEGFDPFIWEKHHASKGDSPSGTALHMGEVLLERLGDKDLLHMGTASGPIAPNQISVASVRAGSDPGCHHVGFDSANETLELVHTTRDRAAFATGVIRAASWLKGREGVFTMEDVIADQIEAAEKRREAWREADSL